MKLTDQQRTIVSDNHNLIYWYANLRHLDIDEWYGLLAFELCKAVCKHDPNRGSLSNYFKTRADSAVMLEKRKGTVQKRNFETIPVETIEDVIDIGDYEYIEFMDWIDSTGSDVLKLKLDGYTQLEIADELGLTIRQVRTELDRLKEEFNDYRKTYR